MAAVEAQQTQMFVCVWAFMRHKPYHTRLPEQESWQFPVAAALFHAIAQFHLFPLLASTRSYSTADALGSVRAMLGDTGIATSATNDDPYGQIQSGNVGSFGFTGELQQGSSVYLRARWYNASAGSFGSRDPFAGMPETPYSQHYFAYGYSDPIGKLDRTGRSPQIECSTWPNYYLVDMRALCQTANGADTDQATLDARYSIYQIFAAGGAARSVVRQLEM
jgi:RHS repeat-associated protein